MMTDERGITYLGHRGLACPFCMRDIAHMRPEKMDRAAINQPMPCVYVHMRCDNCRNVWVETHRLESVEWTETRNIVVGATVSGDRREGE
jgi:hypothetical protein